MQTDRPQLPPCPSLDRQPCWQVRLRLKVKLLRLLMPTGCGTLLGWAAGAPGMQVRLRRHFTCQSLSVWLKAACLP